MTRQFQISDEEHCFQVSQHAQISESVEFGGTVESVVHEDSESISFHTSSSTRSPVSHGHWEEV
jgi:hypothetical protein